MKSPKRFRLWLVPVVVLIMLAYASGIYAATEGSEHKNESGKAKLKASEHKHEGSDSKMNKGCPMCSVKAKKGSEHKNEGSGSKMKKGCSMCPLQGKKGMPMVNTAAIRALVNSKTKMIVLDARSGKWDDGKRIPGAKQLSPDATKNDIKKAVGEDKNALIITYCGGPQCPLSSKLAERLKKMGYTNVIEYPEGMPGWTEAGGKMGKVKEGSEHKEGSGSK